MILKGADCFSPFSFMKAGRAMIRAFFKGYNNFEVDSVHQWDLNRTLYIEGLGLDKAPKILFANSKSMTAAQVTSVLESGKVVCPIPNALLTEAYPITAYIKVTEGSETRTIEKLKIPVVATKKPADYEYIENVSVIDYQEIMNAIELKEDKATVASIRSYLESDISKKAAQTDFNTLKSRVDNLASLPSGSTSGDAELTDIRVGADGTQYSSAGEAVREQVGDIKEDLAYQTNRVENLYESINGIKETEVEIPRTLYPISIYNGESITLKTKDGSKFLNDSFLLYDSDRNEIDWWYLGRGSNSSITKTIYFSNVAYIGIEGVTKQKVIVVQTLSKNLVQTVANIKNSIGAYELVSYFGSHVSSKVNVLNNLLVNSSKNTLRFGFITDVHWNGNTKQSPSLMNYLYVNAGLRDFFLGGDTINVGNKSDMIYYIHEQMRMFTSMYNDRFYPMIGNHEFNTEGTHDAEITENELYNLMFKHIENKLKSTNFYYYIDNAAQKTRYFILNTGKNSIIDSTQIDWFFNELKSVPNGYSVIVFGHWFYNGSNGSFTPTSYCTSIVEALGALKNKTTFNYGNASYDYSGTNNDVICIICGHTHEDAIINNTQGFPSIMTTCDKLQAESDRDTYTSQAFDVFTIDKDTRTINITRIGKGSDRTATY